MIEDLFEPKRGVVLLAPRAMVLRGFAQPFGERLVAALGRVVERAPFRHMVTPGGHRMSVAMTNCGAAGWVTDRAGYRYDHRDPESGGRWPAMPDEFAALAVQAAARAGFDGFAPDACLVNRYEPGTRLSLHQDRNEPLAHGDVAVWGGPARLTYHGVMPLDAGRHPVLGGCRINLTFRKAG